jgi:hypothetical protein
VHTQIYYFGSAIVAGSCVSSGLFVPMLLMGACIGRFWGLVAVRVALQVPGFEPDHLQLDEWKARAPRATQRLSLTRRTVD